MRNVSYIQNREPPRFRLPYGYMLNVPTFSVCSFQTMISFSSELGRALRVSAAVSCICISHGCSANFRVSLLIVKLRTASVLTEHLGGARIIKILASTKAVARKRIGSAYSCCRNNMLTKGSEYRADLSFFFYKNAIFDVKKVPLSLWLVFTFYPYIFTKSNPGFTKLN